MQHAQAVHLYKEHDVAPALCAALFIMPSGDACDAHTFNLVHARFSDTHRISQRSLKIVVIIVVVARSYGIYRNGPDRIACARRTGVHQNPHAGFAGQKETGMA